MDVLSSYHQGSTRLINPVIKNDMASCNAKTPKDPNKLIPKPNNQNLLVLLDLFAVVPSREIKKEVISPKIITSYWLHLN